MAFLLPFLYLRLVEQQRYILHADLDSFFVSVERILDPSLVGKPVIVGGSANRGVVASCSYEARAFGVHSAMPSKQAQKLCPQAIFVSGSSAEYSRYSKWVSSIIADMTPLYEKASIDEFYIDLSGMEKFFGCYSYGQKIRSRIMEETKLPISFGLSANKMIAKMATNQAKPNGHLFIPQEKILDFISPLSIRKIPFLGEKTEQVLNQTGVKTIAELREVSLEKLVKQFGKQGMFLYNSARGINRSLVEPYQESKSLSVERTFDIDTNQKEWLEKVIVMLAEKLAQELRKEEMLTSCITLKLRFPDFKTITKQTQISYTASTKKLTESLLHLFQDFYKTGTKIRLLGIRFSELIKGNQQSEMFNEEQTDLYKAIDEVKLKYGFGKISIAENLDMGNVKRNQDVRSASEKDE